MELKGFVVKREDCNMKALLLVKRDYCVKTTYEYGVK